MPERQGRYSAEQRAEFAANRRAAAGKAKYGGSYEQQGYRPQKEMGEAFLNRQELKAKYGAFANPTWQYEDRGGQLYRKPLPGQTGRIAEQGGTAQWEPVPDYVQRSYANPRRRAFFAQNPDLASRPGGGQDAWLYNRYVTSLPIDPVSGLRVNPAGELYDPKAWGTPGYGGGAVGQVGQPSGPPMVGPGFQAPGAPPWGPSGFGQGYIPGYAIPPMGQGYQQGWGAYRPMGGPQGPSGPAPMQPPGIQMPRYGPQGFAPGPRLPGQPAPQQGSPWLRGPSQSYQPRWTLPQPQYQSYQPPGTVMT